MNIEHGERILNLQQAVTSIWKDLEYVRELLDTGADNNYLAQHMVDKLGLNLSKCSKRVKVVNLGAVAMLGETKIKGKEASYAERKYNKALERGKCMATLETKSGVVAESVGLVDKMQSSMASSGGPIEF
ncbi:hypothetical protein ACOSP7_018560 [Xanthoceras sorbifolium]